MPLSSVGTLCLTIGEAQFDTLGTSSNSFEDFTNSPSIVMVVYGLVTETSVADLFLAGFVPGFLMIALFMVTIALIVRRDAKAGPAGAPTNAREKLLALKNVWAMMLLFTQTVTCAASIALSSCRQ